MIRIKFDAALDITKPERSGPLLKALDGAGFVVAPIAHNDGAVTFVLRNTDMQAYDLITNHMKKAKNYVICNGCNSIHFKTEETCKDPFECPCGNNLNKPIKQKK